MRPMPQGVRGDVERLSRLTRSDARKEGAWAYKEQLLVLFVARDPPQIDFVQESC
jgi:hypothetical protein